MAVSIDNSDVFVKRHIGPDDGDVTEMLRVVGAASVDELIDQTIPSAIRLNLHGEYQIRYQGQTTLPLQPPIGQPQVSTLGQNQYLYHWLRLGLRIQIGARVAVGFTPGRPSGGGAARPACSREKPGRLSR